VKRLTLAGLAVLMLVGTALALPARASAHALAQSSVPADGATLQSSPADVTITFGETPDPSLSSISVVDTSGTSWTAGPTVVNGATSLQLRAPLKHLPRGSYTVTWRTVSAVDGHQASGAFSFGVGVSPGSAKATSSVAPTAPSPFAVVARLLLFVGLIVVVGSVTLGFGAFGGPTPLLRRTIAAGAAVSLLGTAGVTGAQISGAGVALSGVLGSSLGRSLILRGVPVLVLLVATAFLLRGRWLRPLALVAGVAALGAMLVDATNSHAAGESPATLNEFAQWLHIAAVGVWIGGLVALLVSVMGAPSDQKAHAARRFSKLAGIGLLVVAATGVFRAVIEVQTWGNLVGTAFGVLVLLKIGLIVILAGLGAINRYRNVPNVPRMLHALRRVVTTEVIVALGALTVAAALVNVAPPAEYAPAAAQAVQPVVASGSDFGTTVKVHLTVSPGTAGLDTYTLTVNDYDSGQPVDARRVELTFTLPNQTIIASSNLLLSRSASGVYNARAANLAVDGTWNVVALIEQGMQSVEVPLTLTTRSTPPVVTVTPFTGLPTLYTIHVTHERSAQVYIDPDKPGATEFHVTFLDARGNEIPIASAAVSDTAPGGSRMNLTLRRLDSIGHFVADANVRTGSSRFDIIASTASGEVLSTYIELSPGS